jgi:squalene cyclase
MNATDFLLQAQNADGGWGYRINGASYVEPTAAVLLALTDATARARGRDFLLSLQHADGGWGIGAMDDASGWMTAWAVRALIDFAGVRDAVERGVSWLQVNEGLRVIDEAERARVKQTLKIDSTLRGWAWQIGDASWVHPTALAMWAMVSAGQGAHVRVRDGVQYLFDRVCPGGGWNIGNPWMLDKQMPATIQDTAVALLALQSAPPSLNEPRIVAAIDFLRGAMMRAQTPAELAWGAFALRAWRVDVSDVTGRLNALQKANGGWNDNPFITAIAVLANKT